MKLRHISLLTLTAIVFCCFSSCLKKGEDDPSFSLRTRKARVVGKWKIESGSEIYTNVYYASGFPITKLTTKYSENTFEQKVEGNNTNVITTGSVSYEMEFKKDGDFISTIVFNNISTTVVKGVWNFTGKVGEHKNKEQIVIHLISRSYTSTRGSFVNNTSNSYQGNKSDVTYFIKELRNKKIVLISDYSSTDHTGETYTINSDLTFIQ